ncbi:MAG: S26 family signal peptidase [Xanthomonadaceae bacterium]|nr:S26 family signal peptidase [Xanthomonadaceae bacterium]
MTRRMLLACMGISVAALCVSAAVQMQVRVVYNPTDSVARGWYLIGPSDALHVGSIVLVQLSPVVAAFATQRGYLPKEVPILKRIGAVAPQSVCVRGQAVHIDGAAVATVLAHDGKHRPLLPWAQCRVLMEGELFLLSDVHPASFDSRYFGTIDASAVLGTARPIWTGRAQ